jgi:ABC-2 type transport system permease protein
MIPTFAYTITVNLVGSPDMGPIIGGYIGSLLLGAGFSAIGIFASSLTKNQIIAFIIGMMICFALTLLDKMLIFLPQSAISVLGYLGADFHFQNISRGIVDSRDIIYFLSLVFIALYGTNLTMSKNN